jgi:hypothetical protein
MTDLEGGPRAGKIQASRKANVLHAQADILCTGGWTLALRLPLNTNGSPVNTCPLVLHTSKALNLSVPQASGGHLLAQQVTDALPAMCQTLGHRGDPLSVLV